MRPVDPGLRCGPGPHLKAKNYAEGSKARPGQDNRPGVNAAAAGLDEDHRACSAAGFIVGKNAVLLFLQVLIVYRRTTVFLQVWYAKGIQTWPIYP